MGRQEAQHQPYTCPADRKGLDRDRDVFPDNATGRKILSMVIKCPSDGCSWTGELRDKEAHLEACKFKIVNCTNKNCDATVKRRDLEQHTTNTCEWRIIECEYCEDLNPKKHVELHLLLCRKIPLSCPYSCGISIPREMIQNHIDNDCPLCLVSCPYAKMGCIKKLQRKNVDPHLQSNTREHLDLC
ncbi:TNF receptor-associated factor 6-like isoform X2 [Porites lutea]|uniref:TNF receptor-associated factor 6-like isoform X2 n=1 Tax=Porites lutea TaxID=51062 RepID=UPI003CC53C6B